MNTRQNFLVGALVDGCGNDIQKKMYLTVNNGRIEDIGKIDDLKDGAHPTVDLSHCIALPPFIDCSVSLGRSASTAGANKATVRSDIVAGRHINDCYGHGVLAVLENDMAAEALKELEPCPLNIHTAKSILKITYSQSIEAGLEKTPAMEYEALKKQLHQKGGRKSIIIANGQDHVAEALAAGCDALEQGYSMGRDNLQTMAEQNILWIPSMVRAQSAGFNARQSDNTSCRFSIGLGNSEGSSQGAEKWWADMLEQQSQQLRMARELGVKVALGTGAGSPGVLHGESIIDEMKLFMQAGYSLAEVIACASENSAQFFNIQELGALRVGGEATFLLTRGSVKQLPRKLSYLEAMYIRGLPSTSYRKNPVKFVS